MSPSTHPRPSVDALADALVQQASDLCQEHDHLSRIIEHLNLPLEDLEDHYQPVPSHGFDFEAILRVFLYKHITDSSDCELAQRFTQWAFLPQRFDLDRPPRQQTLSYTWRNRLDLHTRQLITTAAEGIRKELHDHNIASSEIAPPAPTPDDVVDGEDGLEPVHHYVDRNVGDFMDIIQQSIYSAFQTGRAANTKHSDERVWYSQTKMSFMGEHSGTKSTFRALNRAHEDVLHNDTHVRAVKKCATPSDYQYTLDEFGSTKGKPIPSWRRITETLQDPFHDAVSSLLSSIRGTDLFTEPVAAAIDITFDLFYVSPWKSPDEILPGDERIVVNERTGRTKVPKPDYPEMVSGKPGKHKRGYPYATLTIAGWNAPIVLAVEPVRRASIWEGEDGESETYAEIVDRLLTKAEQLVDIHLVMADRAFESHEVYDVIDSHDMSYLIPKKKYDKDWEGIENVQEHPTADVAVEPDVPLHIGSDASYVEPGYSHDVTFMYVPSRNKSFEATEGPEGSYAVFVTNRDDVSPDDAMGLTDRYSQRWDIENEYKSIKRFLPSIASTDFRMRCFAFLFATLLYNVWRIVDFMMKILVYEKYADYGPEEGRTRPRPVITANGCVDTIVNVLDPPY